jgi:ATP-binding cassette, subfamily C, bacterial EexD
MMSVSSGRCSAGGAVSSSQPLSDINGLRQYVSGNGLLAFFDAPWLPVYLAIMFMFHPILGVLGLLSAIALIAIAIANEKSTAPPLDEANSEHMAASTTTNKNLRNVEVVESMGMLASLRQRWDERNTKMLHWQGVASDRAGTFMAISKTLRLAVQSLALGWGPTSRSSRKSPLVP